MMTCFLFVVKNTEISAPLTSASILKEVAQTVVESVVSKLTLAMLILVCHMRTNFFIYFSFSPDTLKNKEIVIDL